MSDLLDILHDSWEMLRSWTGDSDPLEVAVRLCQLERWQAGKAPLTQTDIDYWSARFREQDVRGLADCSFERYLMRPLYYERIAHARRILADRTDRSSIDNDNQITQPHEH